MGCNVCMSDIRSAAVTTAATATAATQQLLQHISCSLHKSCIRASQQFNLSFTYLRGRLWRWIPTYQ